MTPLRVGVIAAFVAFSVVAIIMNTMMHGWLAWYRLAREGKHVQATITARRPEFHETCHFTYTVASRTYEGADQGSYFRVGEVVQLTYSPRGLEIHEATLA